MNNRRKLFLVWGASMIGVPFTSAQPNLGAQPRSGQSTSDASRASKPMQWGAFVQGSIPQFEAMVGRKMDLQSVFVEWEGSNSLFPMQLAPLIRDKGKTMLLFWESWGKTPGVEQPDFSLDMIALGKWDKYIATFAAAAKLYGGPIILNPFHEMNGNWYPWCGTVNGNSASKLIAAWRHIHSFFKDANNVKFGWVVNSNSVPDTQANSIAGFYPGDAYVDYVGVDGFNNADQWPWASFKEIFEPALVQLRKYRKPIYIFSIGCAPGPKKAEWILDALGTQVHQHPIEGWIWFNAGGIINYKIDSDSRSLAAFKRVIPNR